MKPRTRTAVDVASFVVLVGMLSWLMYRGGESMRYNWQWYRVPDFIYSMEDGQFTAGPLLRGLYLTLHITWISLICSFAVGLATALLRLSDSVVGRMLSRGYLELIRNTPLLTQIFFIYFVLSPVLGMGRFTAAVLALSLFEGAYASEIIRSGIVSIPKGQWEAAYSLGLSRWQCYRRVILPQALRRVLPPLTSIAVSLVKDSALVSTIAIFELTMRGQIIIAETFLTFEIWFTVALMYLAMTVTLSLVAAALEKRFRIAT